MINVIIDEIKDNKLWQIEEIIQSLDMIDYAKNNFLSVIGPASDIIEEAKVKLLNTMYDDKFIGIDEIYIILALFLRETSYWYASEIVEKADNSDCPLFIINSYKKYLDYCFYKTEGKEIKRFETIDKLRESLFTKYKHNRNVKDNNEDNIKVLRLLTLINEYKQAMNEQSDY